MEKIKINDKTFEGTMKKISQNHVKLMFADGKKPKGSILKNGFCLVDQKGRIYCNCLDYITIYKEIPEGYILSNDESVYREPQPIPIEEPSAEELAEQKKQAQILEKENEIDVLKKQLSSSDYKFSKMYEYSLIGKSTEYNADALHMERQALRDRINELQEEIAALLEEEVE